MLGLGLALLARPGWAQQTSRPEPRLPPPPAAQPPAPPALAAGPATAGPPAPAPAPRPLALPPSMQQLPGGGWRLAFPPGLDDATRRTLAEIGRRLAADTTGRVSLLSQVREGEDVSTARRLSLERAIEAKAALVAGGMPETRVDVFPLGRTALEVDALDILPPGVARPTPP